MAARAQEDVNGRAQISWFSDDVVQTTWIGRVDGDMMRETLASMQRELATRTVRYWYCDTSSVSNYSVDIRTVSTALLGYVKSRGCEEIVSVVASPAIRMLSMSLAFVVGIRVKVVATAEEARAYLRLQTKGN